LATGVAKAYMIVPRLSPYKHPSTRGRPGLSAFRAAGWPNYFVTFSLQRNPVMYDPRVIRIHRLIGSGNSSRSLQRVKRLSAAIASSKVEEKLPNQHAEDHGHEHDHDDFDGFHRVNQFGFLMVRAA
jgi:hypothetical protein